MKKEVIKRVIVTYCDYCGAELTHTNHSSIILKNGVQIDLCSTYTNDIDKTCLDKYKEETS